MPRGGGGPSMRDRGGMPRGGAGPSVRSPSFANGGDDSPGVSGPTGAGAGTKTRRKAVLAVEDIAEETVTNSGPNHRSEGSSAERSKSKRSKSKKGDGDGGSSGGIIDNDALAALASSSVSARRGARKASVSVGGGGDGGNGIPRLSERMRGGGDDEEKKKSGRHRRGSVKEVPAADPESGGGSKTSGRHRRGSVKEMKSAAAAVVAANAVSGSSGRHRRGSVKEIAPSGSSPAPASSGRHRRGSVKEVSSSSSAVNSGSGTGESNAGMLQALSSASVANSRRHRRASAAAMTDFASPEDRAAPEPAPAPKSSGRHRRGSVKEVSGSDPIAAVVAAAAVVKRHRRLSASAVPDDVGAAAEPAPAPKTSGRHRRGSVKEVASSDAGNGAAVVEGMNFGSIRYRECPSSPRHDTPSSQSISELLFACLILVASAEDVAGHRRPCQTIDRQLRTHIRLEPARSHRQFEVHLPGITVHHHRSTEADPSRKNALVVSSRTPGLASQRGWSQTEEMLVAGSHLHRNVEADTKTRHCSQQHRRPWRTRNRCWMNTRV
eukprot:SAG22_NODE_128_length_18787_cov_19.577108_4_plen_550_part_00